MPDRICFHLDEQVDPDIARALRSHGIDVSTTVDVGLRTASDAAQLAFARQQGRVLVTHDVDFLRMAARDADHAGIAYCHKSERSLGEIIRRYAPSLNISFRRAHVRTISPFQVKWG